MEEKSQEEESYVQWINKHLAQRGLSLESLSQFADGKLFVQFIEILLKTTVHASASHKSRFLCMQDVNNALSVVKQSLEGARQSAGHHAKTFVACSAEDIIDGNKRAVLGLLYQLRRVYDEEWQSQINSPKQPSFHREAGVASFQQSAPESPTSHPQPVYIRRISTAGRTPPPASSFSSSFSSSWNRSSFSTSPLSSIDRAGSRHSVHDIGSYKDSSTSSNSSNRISVDEARLRFERAQGNTNCNNNNNNNESMPPVLNSTAGNSSRSNNNNNSAATLPIICITQDSYQSNNTDNNFSTFSNNNYQAVQDNNEGTTTTGKSLSRPSPPILPVATVLKSQATDDPQQEDLRRLAELKARISTLEAEKGRIEQELSESYKAVEALSLRLSMAANPDRDTQVPPPLPPPRQVPSRVGITSGAETPSNFNAIRRQFENVGTTPTVTAEVPPRPVNNNSTKTSESLRTLIHNSESRQEQNESDTTTTEKLRRRQIPLSQVFVDTRFSMPNQGSPRSASSGSESNNNTTTSTSTMSSSSASPRTPVENGSDNGGSGSGSDQEEDYSFERRKAMLALKYQALPMVRRATSSPSLTAARDEPNAVPQNEGQTLDTRQQYTSMIQSRPRKKTKPKTASEGSDVAESDTAMAKGTNRASSGSGRNSGTFTPTNTTKNPSVQPSIPEEDTLESVCRELGITTYKIRCVTAEPDVKELRKLFGERNTPGLVDYLSFYELTNDDKNLLWKYRELLLDRRFVKKGLTKLLECVDWVATDDISNGSGNSSNNNNNSSSSTSIIDNSRKRSPEEVIQLINSRWKDMTMPMKPNSDEAEEVPLGAAEVLSILSCSCSHIQEVRSIAVRILEEVKDEDFERILLQLVQSLRWDPLKENSTLGSLIIKRACKNFEIASTLNWYLTVEDHCPTHGDMYATIHRRFLVACSSFFEKIAAQQRLVSALSNLCATLSQMSDSRPKKIQKLQALLKENGLPFLPPFSSTSTSSSGSNNNNNNNKGIHHPVRPEVVVTGIRHEDATIFKSAKSPLRLTFITNTGEDYRVIFKKGDDLRQDQLIIQLINLMDSMLREQNLDLRLTPYNVLATSCEDGFVECVENSYNLSHVLNEYKEGGVLAFLRAHHPSADFANGIDPAVLLNFTKSCAGYCVITYLLGIGDRHLDNLMITTEGQLFHIDFGFILGNDPKPFPPPMKLCKEMVDAMGGANSAMYLNFKENCFAAFKILRRHASTIVNMLLLMRRSNIPQISADSMRNIQKMYEKFKIGLSEEDSVKHLNAVIDESLTAIFPQITETIHKIAQQLRT